MSLPLVSTSRILTAARDHICSTLPFAHYHALPIPTFRKRKLSVAVLIGRGEFTSPEAGYKIWPPHLLSLFDAAGGLFAELHSLDPLSDRCTAPLGKGLSPGEKMSVGYAERQIRYCQAADLVLAAASTGTVLDAPMADARRLFAEGAEPLLLGYFDALFLQDWQQ